MRAMVETVEVDGVPVRLWTQAPAGRVRDPSGTTVVLVHGIGLSHRSFRRFSAVLARHHRTVTLDLPGFGGTPGTDGSTTIDEQAALVLGALRATGVERVVALGQSMGTQLAVAMGLAAPDLVAGVVVIGPVVDDARRTLAQQALALLRDGLVEGLRMNAVVLTDYFRSVPQYLRMLPEMMTYPMRRKVAELRVPILVVNGSKDPIADADWARRLVDAAADGTHVEIEGPHHVQEIATTATAAAVDAFIGSASLERRR